MFNADFYAFMFIKGSTLKPLWSLNVQKMEEEKQSTTLLCCNTAVYTENEAFRVVQEQALLLDAFL